MSLQGTDPRSIPGAAAAPAPRGRLFRKYVGLFVAVVCAALAANGLLDSWFSFKEQEALLGRIQHEQAKAAAMRIGQFVKELQGQLGWATQFPWSAKLADEWQFDAERLLRQVEAITELRQLDAEGRAQFCKMRFAVCPKNDTPTDFSHDPAFTEAVAHGVFFGPVRFERGSEPYMTVAMRGQHRNYGVIVAQVNLTFIWDVVNDIKVGATGRALVVDPAGRLIAHPEINLVLRNTDMSHLAQVRAALEEDTPGPPEASVAEDPEPLVAQDIEGRRVLSVHAHVDPLGWRVFIELPLDEAYASIYRSFLRSGVIFLAALVLAAFAGLYLARRMVIPIRALRDRAARIGQGDLTQRIAIETGDELEALADQFNRMAEQLQDSYAYLESKVRERTHQLELANSAKSRFLAVASHDLRQPLHALGLFVAQLRTAATAAERQRIVERIDTAVAMMNELFKALLDISRLDAGALTPNIAEFPVAKLLERVQTTFAGTAKESGLDFRVVPNDAWVRSDFVLLEQILFNLVSNAVRYVARGGVLIGCRKRGSDLRIEIWDTGPGIPHDQHQKIFGEFYRIDDQQRDRRGLGLGLAIVDRLCRLLHHPIELSSRISRGSRFSVIVPMAAATAKAAGPPAPAVGALNLTAEKLIVVIDDDVLALEGTGGLLRSWGCRVVTARSAAEALIHLAEMECPPDLVISDFLLSDQHTGIEAIEQLRAAFGVPIPAFLVSGDISRALLQEARQSGYHLLHKPVDPMPLRTMLNRLLKKRGLVDAGR